MKGNVISINISKKRGIPKAEINEGIFIENFGLKDDAHAGNWHRQVSLLSQESINKMIEQGVENLTSGSFAENITTSGIELYSLPVGTVLKIGETTQRVTQIGKTCHSKCAIFQKIGKCVMPNEGIFTEVLKGGVVRPGDTIEVIS